MFTIKCSIVTIFVSDFTKTNFAIATSNYKPNTNPIDPSVAYLQPVEGGATKCVHGHTFTILEMDWIADKLANREPSAE